VYKEHDTDNLLPFRPACHAAGFKLSDLSCPLSWNTVTNVRARRRVGYMNRGRRKASEGENYCPVCTASHHPFCVL